MTSIEARFCAACDTRVSDSGSEAFAICGLGSNARMALRSASAAAIGVTSAPSASRNRSIARACSCYVSVGHRLQVGEGGGLSLSKQLGWLTHCAHTH